MNGPGGDLLQRDQHEIAPGEAGMRDGQPGRVHDRISGKEDVDVDRARSPVDRRDALHFFFDGLGQIQELLWTELCPDLEDLIEKPWLVRDVDRLGHVDRRRPEDRDAGFLERQPGQSQIPPPAAEVAS